MKIMYIDETFSGGHEGYLTVGKIYEVIEENNMCITPCYVVINDLGEVWNVRQVGCKVVSEVGSDLKITW